MDSFIDLMGNITFTPAQIIKRLSRIERVGYTARDEVVLNRVGTGAALGKLIPATKEHDKMNEFQTFILF